MICICWKFSKNYKNDLLQTQVMTSIGLLVKEL